MSLGDMERNHDMKITAKCPWCGYKNKIAASPDDYKPHLVLCDIEEGGCDKYFVADVEWAASVATYYLTYWPGSDLLNRCLEYNTLRRQGEA